MSYRAGAENRLGEYLEKHQLENLSDVVADVLHAIDGDWDRFKEIVCLATAYYEAEWNEEREDEPV